MCKFLIADEKSKLNEQSKKLKNFHFNISFGFSLSFEKLCDFCTNYALLFFPDIVFNKFQYPIHISWFLAVFSLPLPLFISLSFSLAPFNHCSRLVIAIFCGLFSVVVTWFLSNVRILHGKVSENTSKIQSISLSDFDAKALAGAQAFLLNLSPPPDHNRKKNNNHVCIQTLYRCQIFQASTQRARVFFTSDREMWSEKN